MTEPNPNNGSTPAAPRKDHLDGTAYAVLLACCMFWGLQQVLAKATLAEVPPVLQSAVRAVGASWGLTTVVIQATRLSGMSAERLLFYQLASSAVVLPIISAAIGERWPAPAALSAFAWGSLFLQTAVGAFASYLAWMWMLTRYPVAKMSAFVFLTPVFALVLAAWLLGESITHTLIISVALVCVGIVWVNKR